MCFPFVLCPKIPNSALSCATYTVPREDSGAKQVSVMGHSA